MFSDGSSDSDTLKRRWQKRSFFKQGTQKISEQSLSGLYASLCSDYNNPAQLATIAHTIIPTTVGSKNATPVHFQLCVSLRMVNKVVEQGK